MVGEDVPPPIEQLRSSRLSQSACIKLYLFFFSSISFQSPASIFPLYFKKMHTKITRWWQWRWPSSFSFPGLLAALEDHLRQVAEQVLRHHPPRPLHPTPLETSRRFVLEVFSPQHKYILPIFLHTEGKNILFSFFCHASIFFKEYSFCSSLQPLSNLRKNDNFRIQFSTLYYSDTTPLKLLF